MAQYIGELSALAAALSWAVAAVLFRRVGVRIPPLLLNLCKGAIASVLLASAILLTNPQSLWAVQPVFWWLVLSGAVGIGIGDTAFFAALNRLGERRTLLVAETIAPALTACFAFVWLAERLSALSLTGITITVAGVAWVIAERNPATLSSRTTKRVSLTATILVARPTSRVLGGLLYAFIAAASQSVGAVISRQAFLVTDIGPMESSLVRIVGGLAVLLIAVPAVKLPAFKLPVTSSMPLAESEQADSRTRWAGRWRLCGGIVVATLLGTLIGILLQQTSLKYTSAGISQTLIATSALFSILFASWQGERITPRSILGAVVAIVGIAILFAV